MKRFLCILLVLALSLGVLISCGKPDENVRFSVGVLSGPTGMGLSKLICDTPSDSESLAFFVYPSPDTAVAELVSGRLHALCLPTNTAAKLYNNDPDLLSVVGINCLGSLFLLSDGMHTVSALSDLEGQTVYTAVPSSTTVPILNHLLKKNGVNATVETEPTLDALVAKIAANEVAFAVLPEPKATAAVLQNSLYSIDLNLSSEWDRISSSPLTMGCIVVRKDFLASHPETVRDFTEKCRASVDFVTDPARRDEAAGCIVEAGILPKLPIAKKALINLGASIVFTDGKDMKTALSDFYAVLSEYSVDAIGGKLPDDGFYHEK